MHALTLAVALANAHKLEKWKKKKRKIQICKNGRNSSDMAEATGPDEPRAVPK